MALKALKSSLKFVLSNTGIFLILTIYVTLGAYFFQLFEYKEEDDNKRYVERYSRITEAFSDTILRNIWLMRSYRNFSLSVDLAFDQIRARIIDGLRSSPYYHGEVIPNNSLRNSWMFTSALLFTTTTVTTIGYGHVVPATDEGRIFVIIYSVFGIPLMLMFLANIGEWMAGIFRALYYGCCCGVFLDKRRRHYERMRQKTSLWNAKMAKKKRLEQRKSFTYGNQKNRLFDESKVNFHDDQATQTRLRTTVSDKIDLELSYDSRDFFDPIENPDDVKKPNFPVLLTLCVMGAYIVLGAVIFSQMYGWSRMTAAYFSFVTLSTIGFGDYIPHWSDLRTSNGKAKMLASIIYIVFGLAILSMCFNLMIEEIVAKFALFLPKSDKNEQKMDEEGGKKKISGATTTNYADESTYCSRKTTVVENGGRF